MTDLDLLKAERDDLDEAIAFATGDALERLYDRYNAINARIAELEDK